VLPTAVIDVFYVTTRRFHVRSTFMWQRPRRDERG
jgi:hypothetical protein